LIPFIGPYFDYAYTPDTTWTWSAVRGLLQVLPGAVTFAAGLMLIFTRHRFLGWLASWMAIAAGAWFVLGPLLAPIWRSGYLGTPVGDTTAMSMEQLGMFFGLGAAIMVLGGIALGRFSVRGLRDGAVVDGAVVDGAVVDGAVVAAPLNDVEADAGRDAGPRAYTAPAYTAPAYTAPAYTAPGHTAPGYVADTASPVQQDTARSADNTPVTTDSTDPAVQNRTTDGPGPRHEWQHGRRSVFHRTNQ
jgi:hypothetical protein